MADICSFPLAGDLVGDETIAICQDGNNRQVPLEDFIAWAVNALLTGGSLDIQGGSLTVSGGGVNVPGGSVNVPGGSVTLPNSELSQSSDAFVLGDGSTPGSWRFIRDGVTVAVQILESGSPVNVWVTKHTFTA